MSNEVLLRHVRKVTPGITAQFSSWVLIGLKDCDLDVESK